MPKALEDKQIRRSIMLDFNLSGNSRESKAYLDWMTKQMTGFTGTQRRFTAEVRRLTGQYEVANGTLLKLIQSSDKTTKGIKGISLGFSELNGHLRTSIPLFGLLGTELLGFEKSVKFITDFNKALLTTSAQFSKYGIGISAVEQQLNNLSKQTSLTRQESMKLMSGYEKGFNFVSLSRGAQLMMNLKKAVGANSQAMDELQGFLSGIVNKFPELENQITRMNALDRQRLESQARLLVMTGQLSFSEGKRLQDYARQNAQVTEADRQRKQEADDEIEAMNRLDAAVERIAIALGKSLVPVMERLSGLIDQGAVGFEKWIPLIAKIGLSLTGLKSIRLLGKLANFGTGGYAGSAVSKAMSRTVPGIGMSASEMIRSPTGAGGMGLAGGIGASELYKQFYQASTGQDYNQKAGTLGMFGRIGTATAAGAATGGMYGGPVGALAGGTVTAITTELEEGYHVYARIEQQRKDDLGEEAKIIQRLGSETEKWATKAATATSAAQKSYDTLVAVAMEESKQAEQLAVDTKRGGFSAFMHGADRSDEDQAAVDKMRLDATQKLRQASLSQGAKEANAESDRANAAVAKARDDARQKMEASRSTNGVNANLYDQLSSTIGDPSQSEKFANAFAQSFKDIQSGIKSTIVSTTLGADERKKLNIGDSFTAGGPEADRLKARYDELSAKSAKGMTSGVEDDELKDVAKQMDAINQATSGWDQSMQNAMGTLQQIGTVADHALTAYSAERAQLDATAQQMFLSGKIDVAQLTRIGEQANVAYKRAMDLRATQANAIAQTSSQVKKGNDDEVVAAQKAFDASPTGENREALANAKFQQSQSAQKYADDERAAKIASEIAASSQNQLDIAQAILKAGDQMVAFNQQNLALQQSQLALSMQYGNSAADNVQTIGKMLDINQEGIGKYEKQLSIVRGEMSKLNPVTEQTEIIGLKQKEIEYSKQINEARSQQLSIMQQIGNVNKANVDYASAEADKYSAMVDLADSMGMGVQASAQARMQVAKALGSEIQQVQVERKALQDVFAKGQDGLANQLLVQHKGDPDYHMEDAQNEAANQLLSIKTQLAQKDTQIYGLMSKQASITKTLRDGYLSAIQAMTTGTGIFAKFMFTQEKGLGALITNVKGVPQAMGTGSFNANRTVGQRGFSQFSPMSGGLTGRYDFNLRPSYNIGGGPEMAQYVNASEAERRDYTAQGFTGQAGTTAGVMQQQSGNTPGTQTITTQAANDIFSGTLPANAGNAPASTSGMTPTQRTVFRVQQQQLTMLKEIRDAIDRISPLSTKPVSPVALPSSLAPDSSAAPTSTSNIPGLPPALQMAPGVVATAANGMSPSRMTPGHYPNAGDTKPVFVNRNEMILNPKQHRAISKSLGVSTEGLLKYHAGMPKAADGMAPDDDWEEMGGQQSDTTPTPKPVKHGTRLPGHNDSLDTPSHVPISSMRAEDQNPAGYEPSWQRRRGEANPARASIAAQLGISAEEQKDNDYWNSQARAAARATKVPDAKGKPTDKTVGEVQDEVDAKDKAIHQAQADLLRLPRAQRGEALSRIKQLRADRSSMSAEEGRAVRAGGQVQETYLSNYMYNRDKYVPGTEASVIESRKKLAAAQAASKQADAKAKASNEIFMQSLHRPARSFHTIDYVAQFKQMQKEREEERLRSMTDTMRPFVPQLRDSLRFYQDHFEVDKVKGIKAQLQELHDKYHLDIDDPSHDIHNDDLDRLEMSSHVAGEISTFMSGVGQSADGKSPVLTQEQADAKLADYFIQQMYARKGVQQGVVDGQVQNANNPPPGYIAVPVQEVLDGGNFTETQRQIAMRAVAAYHTQLKTHPDYANRPDLQAGVIDTVLTGMDYGRGFETIAPDTGKSEFVMSEMATRYQDDLGPDAVEPRRIEDATGYKFDRKEREGQVHDPWAVMTATDNHGRPVYYERLDQAQDSVHQRQERHNYSAMTAGTNMDSGYSNPWSSHVGRTEAQGVIEHEREVSHRNVPIKDANGTITGHRYEEVDPLLNSTLSQLSGNLSRDQLLAMNGIAVGSNGQVDLSQQTATSIAPTQLSIREAAAVGINAGGNYLGGEAAGFFGLGAAKRKLARDALLESYAEQNTSGVGNAIMSGDRIITSIVGSMLGGELLSGAGAVSGFANTGRALAILTPSITGAAASSNDTENRLYDTYLQQGMKPKDARSRAKSAAWASFGIHAVGNAATAFIPGIGKTDLTRSLTSAAASGSVSLATSSLSNYATGQGFGVNATDVAGALQVAGGTMAAHTFNGLEQSRLLTRSGEGGVGDLLQSVIPRGIRRMGSPAKPGPLSGDRLAPTETTPSLLRVGEDPSIQTGLRLGRQAAGATARGVRATVETGQSAYAALKGLTPEMPAWVRENMPTFPKLLPKAKVPPEMPAWVRENMPTFPKLLPKAKVPTDAVVPSNPAAQNPVTSTEPIIPAAAPARTSMENILGRYGVTPDGEIGPVRSSMSDIMSRYGMIDDETSGTDIADLARPPQSSYGSRLQQPLGEDLALPGVRGSAGNRPASYASQISREDYANFVRGGNGRAGDMIRSMRPPTTLGEKFIFDPFVNLLGKMNPFDTRPAGMSRPRYHTGGDIIAGSEGKEVTVLAGEGITRVHSISDMKGTNEGPMTVNQFNDQSGNSASPQSGGGAAPVFNFNFTIDTTQIAGIPQKVNAAIDEVKKAMAGDGQITSGKTFNTYGR
jgi:hypothetical protein